MPIGNDIILFTGTFVKRVELMIDALITSRRRKGTRPKELQQLQPNGMVLPTGTSQGCSTPSINTFYSPHLALSLGSWDPLPQLGGISCRYQLGAHIQSPATPPHLMPHLLPKGTEKMAMSMLCSYICTVY